MRIFVIAAMVALSFGCSERPVSIEPKPPSVVGVEPGSKEPRFVFSAPDGFEWNAAQNIWHNEATRTSITLAHAPATSFQSVVDDIDADRMLASHMKLIAKDIRNIDGRPTLLVHGDRLNAPVPQQFYMVAFATSTGSAQITAIYPTDIAEELKAQIETSLLTSRWETPD